MHLRMQWQSCVVEVPDAMAGQLASASTLYVSMLQWVTLKG